MLRKTQLSETADSVLTGFHDQILPFDAPAAAVYSLVVSLRDAAGSPIDVFDAQIAAICRVHEAPVVTRNVRDFHGTGISIIDPWS